LLKPKPVAFDELIVALNAVGSVIVTDAVAVQLFASVTVTV
jgi:hypothetical protein